MAGEMKENNKPPMNKLKAKKRSKKNSYKSKDFFVPYENPDLKVIVRLLPPTMEEEAFLQQLPSKYNPLDNTLVKSYYYEKGAPALKPFEEPTFSRANFLFQEKETAEQFKVDLPKIVFVEPHSNDQFQCLVLKPIYGSIPSAPKTEALGPITETPLFIEFLKQRQATSELPDLSALMKMHQKAKDAKKKEARIAKRKARASLEKKSEQTGERIEKRESQDGSSGEKQTKKNGDQGKEKTRSKKNVKKTMKSHPEESKTTHTLKGKAKTNSKSNPKLQSPMKVGSTESTGVQPKQKKSKPKRKKPTAKKSVETDDGQK